MTIRAALFDFGGVVTTSPFESFARYEVEHGLPADFIRTLNATNPDTNAWAQLERSTIDSTRFCELYEDEARAAGHELVAADVLACLGGDIRDEMITAIKRCKERLTTGCITNNIASMTDASEGRPAWHDAFALDELFDVVIESSKVGVRKPDPKIYELACDAMGVEPSEVVFLDDLGINLKPAAAMGMTTIKVVDSTQAITDLETIVGFALR
jgi:putative hydrolase of the HAD superfamily